MYNITRDKLRFHIEIQLLLIVYSFAGVVAKVASKSGILTLKFFMYFTIEAGILFIYAIFWQQMIKKADITRLYSNRAIVIIWSMLWSYLIFNESISANNIIGAIIIIIGVIKVVSDD